MSVLQDWSRSLLVALPSSYDQIRPHHLVLAGALLKTVRSTSIYRTVAGTILSYLSLASETIGVPLVMMGLVPDFLIRYGIRIQLQDRLNSLRINTTNATGAVEQELQDKMKIVEELHQMPIAIETDSANEQHYEVPPKFYDLCLGPHKKYSSGLWPTGNETFEESEVHMLDLYCVRAGVKDGMKIVDLGCGWGSLSLHLAKKFPNAKITAISNSSSQREYILSTAATRGLKNITVITCDVANDTKGVLNEVKNNDLVMTVEMFEHMKNYQVLMHKIHGFLKPKGKLFVHIFSHKDYVYHMEDGWMARTFFTGGTQPSDDLLLYFAEDFHVKNHWRVQGTHYSKTSNMWLKTMDDNWKNGELKPVLREAYGEGKEYEWYVNWRIFFMACAELWGFDGGNEWIVSHYLFERR